MSGDIRHHRFYQPRHPGRLRAIGITHGSAKEFVAQRTDLFCSALDWAATISSGDQAHHRGAPARVRLTVIAQWSKGWQRFLPIRACPLLKYLQPPGFSFILFRTPPAHPLCITSWALLMMIPRHPRRYNFIWISSGGFVTAWHRTLDCSEGIQAMRTPDVVDNVAVLSARPWSLPHQTLWNSLPHKAPICTEIPPREWRDRSYH